jgi:sec-independent protein translocase protein TatB
MLSVHHMIVVFVIVLVVFGPQKLPELARGLGKLMAEFRKASTDFKSAFEEEMRDLERQAREVERRKAETAAASAAAQPQPATLATPSGAETQPAPAELAASAVAGATEASAAEASTPGTPVVGPVSESTVARDESAERTIAREAANSEAGSLEPAEAPELQEKAQRARTDATES